ncbi:MAG: hypothetical protein J6Y18_02425 [Candidatus Methanomethylophilaceae archaeon]|nr:hypothetical protein [Candidatus Methanomethylophilaceae archaeon]
MDLANTRIHPDYIAAILMIGLAIMGLYDNWYLIDSLSIHINYDTVEFFLNPALAVICALILIFTKHGSPAKTLTVTALFFSVILLDMATLDLVILGEYLQYDIPNFIHGVLMLLMGSILVVNSLIYWSKASNNLILIFYALSCVLLLEIIEKLIYYRNGSSVVEILEDSLTSIFIYALAIYIILLLRSDSVKVNTMMYNIREHTRKLREAAIPAGVVIDRAQIQVLEDIVRYGLDGDTGVIYLNSYYPMDYKIVLNRIGGGTSLCFSSIEDDTGVGMTRFVMKGIWTDTGDAGTCDVVRIYGDDMFFIQLIAGDPYTTKSEKRSFKELLSFVFKKDVPEES